MTRIKRQVAFASPNFYDYDLGFSVDEAVNFFCCMAHFLMNVMGRSVSTTQTDDHRWRSA